MKIKPWVALLLIAPAIGEVTCGNTPPTKFVDVVGLVVMTIVYGGGALLVREVVVRLNKGWPTLLVLGAAYGIIEEGIMCKSFFDPNWPGVVEMAGYDRLGGVNWIWSVFLTVYHAVYSIGFSVLIAETFYPAVRRVPWLKRSGIIWLGSLFVTVVVLGHLAFPGPVAYRPPLGLTVGALLAVVALIVLAVGLRKPKPAPASNPKPIAVYAIAGLVAPVLFHFFAFGGPSTALPFPTFLACGLVACIAFAVVMTWLVRADAGWDKRRRAAFMSGVILMMTLIGLLVDAGKHMAGGMILVAPFEVALVVALSKSLKTVREAPPPIPEDAVGGVAG